MMLTYQQVGMARCAVPVTEQSVRRRKAIETGASFTTVVAPQPGADGAARRPYH